MIFRLSLIINNYFSLIIFRYYFYCFYFYSCLVVPRGLLRYILYNEFSGKV